MTNELTPSQQVEMVMNEDKLVNNLKFVKKYLKFYVTVFACLYFCLFILYLLLKTINPSSLTIFISI